MRFTVLLFLVSLNSCQLNWYGDIALGADFYYLVEPAFNYVAIPVDKNEPYKTSIYVIKEIENVGFNEKYILASSSREQQLTYWKVDKTLETEKLDYRENSIIRTLF